ncbi:bacteriohemerythrin [Azospirillum sp.]|uniref:bacteriohemerythrin n=1 Tax=Azospirillum sp. TaxID=34012 RepID=UPI003D759950
MEGTVAPLEWTEAHAVGDPEIDEQHQQLFELYNRALHALQANPGQLTPGAVLQALIDYTDYHFATEEAVMDSAGYPGRAEHVREHKALLTVVSDFVVRVEADPRVLSDVVGLLRVWIQGHVLCADRDLGAFLKGRW